MNLAVRSKPATWGLASGALAAMGIPLLRLVHEFKNYIRISYANAWNKKTENALATLGHLCQSLWG